MELCSTFHLQTVMTNYDDPDTVQFRLGGLVCQLSVPEFGAALGLCTKEFKEENELHTLTRHIHFSLSKCWHTLALGAASYNPSRSKALVLPPILRYLHAILAHTIIGREEEAYEDIPDDVPTQHEDPPTQQPPPSRPVHAAASYADISDCLTRFEQ
ncbi:Malate dehydrogenase [Gossypium arboreum]|uniref:Malate dehydrogenase n=1 Tax=Gossypium arboreum TaxID=29729 RepID=A0A0B0NUM5_GOSAR|nr:Malate dehydrogenase [Gossypium arboreum]